MKQFWADDRPEKERKGHELSEQSFQK
jgi:hypothetical protein